MMTSNSSRDHDEFQREHTKRERHVPVGQWSHWADDLIRNRLGDSPAFRLACTPAGRLEEQRRLLELQQFEQDEERA